MAERYEVELDKPGCAGCDHGRTWVVVDRTEDAEVGGQSFDDAEDAQALAGACNNAYYAGRDSKAPTEDECAVILREVLPAYLWDTVPAYDWPEIALLLHEALVKHVTVPR